MNKHRIFHEKIIDACKSGNINELEGFLDQTLDRNTFKEAISEYGKPLLFVCSMGNEAILQLIIKHGAYIGKTYKNGKNALTVAYEKGNRHLFDILISNGADFNCQHGFKLLLENCKLKEMNDLEFLLKHGAPTSWHESNGFTALMEVAQNGFEDKVRLLLNHCSINGKNEFGLSSLHFACMNNHKEVVRLLIEKDADVNSMNHNGETPLMLALKNNHIEIVDLLISCGADLFLKNENEQTCLSLVYQKREISKFVEYLILKEPSLINEDKEFLVEVVRQNDLQMIKLLIERNIDLNVQEKIHKDTALMKAIKYDRFEFIQLLLKHDANIDLQNENGESALMIALMSENFQLAKRLIEKEAKLNLTDKHGNSALMIAARHCPQFEMIQLMIEKGADVNVQNDEAETVLIISLENGNFKTIQYLIEHKAHLNVTDKYGKTLFNAYFGFKKTRDIEIIKWLLNTNINFNQQDKMGKTLLHHACSDGKIELVHLLIKKSIDLNIQDNEGKTPLMISVDRQHFIISEMLIDNNAHLDVLDKNQESIWFYLCEFNLLEFERVGSAKSFRRLLQTDYKTSRDYYTLPKSYSTSEDIKWFFKIYKQVDEKTLLLFQDVNEFKGYLADCHKRCMEKLTKKSNWIDKANKTGQTPLLRTVQCESDQWIIELLIKNGANVSHKDNKSETALYLALRKNLVEIAELLIKNGANVNEHVYSRPYLNFDLVYFLHSDLLSLLIKSGANLHDNSTLEALIECKSRDWDTCKRNEKLKIMSKALINELIETFKYTDYEKFKQQVIESIDNQNLILIEANHLKALSFLSDDQKEQDEVIAHLISSEFRERLIVDYINVLSDQIELLEIKKIKLNENFPELSEKSEQFLLNFSKLSEFCELLTEEEESCNNPFVSSLPDYSKIYNKYGIDDSEASKWIKEHWRLKRMIENCRFYKMKFNQLVSGEISEYMVDLVESQSNREFQVIEYKNLIESINKYIKIITKKMRLGHELLELVEKKK